MARGANGYWLGVGAVLCGLLGDLGAAWALDPAKRLEDYVRRTWSVEQGLPQAQVRAIAQTPDGYLWVGTDGGLARFDGVKFTVFDADNTEALGGYTIYALTVDDEGALWIGTRLGSGLVRFKDGRFDSLGDQLKLSLPTVTVAFKDSGGRLWFGGWAGLTRHAGGGFETITNKGGINGSILAIEEDAKGELWFGTSAGLFRFADGRFTPTTTTSGGAVTERTNALAIDRAGVIWLGTPRGLFRFADGKLERFELDGARVFDLAIDRQGILWLGTSAGLGRWRDGRFELLAGLPLGASARMGPIFEDREGSLWIGSSAGLTRLADGPFATYSQSVGMPAGATTAVHEANDGKLWAATRQGVIARLEQDRVVETIGPDARLPDLLTALWQDRTGRLWIGGNGPESDHVLRFEAGRSLAVKGGGGDVRTLYEDRQGTIWVGTSVLSRYEPERDRLVRANLGIKQPIGAVFAMAETGDGALWVGTRAGVFRREGPAWRLFTQTDGLLDNAVLALHGDAQELWLGTGRGLARWRDGRFTSFAKNEGLWNEPVLGVVADGAGYLWACSPRGLFRVKRPSPHERRFETAPVPFGASDGLRAPFCAEGHGQRLMRARDGRLWLAAAQGLAVVDPARLTRKTTAPTVVVERIAVDGRPFPLATRQVSIPPGRGDLEIEYTTTTLSAAEKARFRYRLHPFDQGWVEAGPRRSAYYTQVPPGAYRFQVNAANDDGVWEGAGAAVSLDLAPRFTQTGIFRAGIVVSIVLPLFGVAWGAHRWRLKRAELDHAVRAEERLRIARDLHDTLAQAFTGIVIMLETASSRLGASGGQALTVIDKAKELARSGLAEARRAVWDLRLRALEKVDLPAALTDLARRQGVEVPIAVEVQGTLRPLPAAGQAVLLRIAQEAITNALRHARPSRITIEVLFEPDKVSVAVRDDGVGFTADAPPGHFGLAGMRERASEIGATLTVDSRPGQGTRVSVVVPARGDRAA